MTSILTPQKHDKGGPGKRDEVEVELGLPEKGEQVVDEVDEFKVP